jgi:single-strand DNA-binding protein
MATGLNLATLIGNVGREPEIRSTKDGKQIAQFSLATTDSWKDRISGEKRERTEWHRVIVFHEGLVSMVKNSVHKGSKLCLQGNIQTRKWLDDTSGIERYVTEIILQNQSATLLLLDNKSCDNVSDGHETEAVDSTISGLNLATLIGNVGREPEIRSTKDGKQIAQFSLATTDSWKDRASGEKRERTEWHRVIVFHEGLVSVIKNYVHKGTKLYLQGNIQTRKWLDDSSGIERYITELILQNQSATLLLLDSKGSDKVTNEHETEVMDADEIPF